jgi:hypothetical protein
VGKATAYTLKGTLGGNAGALPQTPQKDFALLNPFLGFIEITIWTCRLLVSHKSCGKVESSDVDLHFAVS